MARWRNTTFTEDVSGSASPVLNIDANGARLDRVLTLDSYTDHYQAGLDFVGYPLLVRGASNKDGNPCNYISRVTPHAFKGITSSPFAAPPEKIPDVTVGGNPVFYSFPEPPVPNQWGQLFAKAQPGMMSLAPLGAGGDMLIRGVKGTLDPAVAYYATNKLRLIYRAVNYDVYPDYDPRMVNGSGPLASTTTAPIPDEGLIASVGDGQGTPWGRYVTVYYRTSKRMINCRRGLIWFLAEPGVETKATPIPEGFLIEETVGSLQMIWREVPLQAIPWGAIQACDNAVNNAVFTSFKIPVGCAHLDSMDLAELWSPLFLRTADITYKFTVLYHTALTGASAGTPLGWNSALRSVPGNGSVDYRPVSGFSNDGLTQRNPPFRQADFRSLFRPDQPP